LERRDRVRFLLDAFASVAMIAACGAILWGVFVRRPQPVAATQAPPGVQMFREPPAYAVGDSFGRVQGFDVATAPATLAVFLRSGCRYCTESMAFYRRLSAVPKRARIVVFGAQTEETLNAYLKENGFKPDQVFRAKAGELKFFSTPTLAVVGADGKVRGVWRGQLDDKREKEVEAAIR
jgi:peroxiredoxin